jgi:anti-sigma regulatory factor (Ser/Thr protein kinase)
METLVVPVLEASGVAEARRIAAGLAARLGFDEADAGRVAIVASEAATNLAKHAGGGAVLVNAVSADGQVGVEILVLDAGPGITDVDRSLRDGFSTAGSPGTGLGAMRRLAGRFEIYSTGGAGTAMLARVWPRRAPDAARARLEVAGVCVAKVGESACGDAWAVAERPGGATILVADGLGHGPDAAAAAGTAVSLFHERPDLAPGPLLERLHGGLRASRGAAVAAAHVDLARRLVTFAGVGNVSGTILHDGTRSLASHNGTIGHEVRRIREFQYPWPDGALLVLHTDGLGTHWTLDRYPGLATRHPSLVAGVLYRDFKRDRDDVTVVVAREPGT